jgi:hypothetical protein
MKNLKTLFFATSIILITACGNEPSSKKQAPPIEGTYKFVREDSISIYAETFVITQISKDSFQLDTKKYKEYYNKNHINDRRKTQFLKYNPDKRSLTYNRYDIINFSEDFKEFTTDDNKTLKKIK